MPIKNDPTVVTAHIHQALQDSILTQNEADQLLNEVKQDGVTEEEVHALVDSLKQALSGSADVSLDVSTAERKETINRFLGRVNEEKALPLGDANGSAATGSVNWLNLMTMQSDAVAQPLDKDSFSGVEVSVDGEGQIFAGDGLVDLAADKPSDTAIDALWALNKPGQLENLTDQELDGLTQNMLGVIETHQGVPNDQPGKYRKIVASTAAAGMLSETAETWDEETTNQVLALAKEAPAPMLKSLLLRGLDKASLTPEQQTLRGDLENPEHMDALLKQFDDVRSEKAKAKWTKMTGEAARVHLNALAFARKPDSIDNISEGMGKWRDLNSDYSNPWDSEEIGHMDRILEGYVDKYPQTSFVYGTFKNDAAREIANVTNAHAVEALSPSLEEEPPTFQGFPLTGEQADFIKTLLPNIETEKAGELIAKSLGQADALFKQELPSTWYAPEAPEKPLSDASFEFFKRAATSYQERVGGSETGKLDYSDFLKDFKSDVAEAHKVLQPRMKDLGGTPPTWDGIALSDEAASFVKTELEQHFRTPMSVDNIGRGLKTVADAHGGKIEGESFKMFNELVTDYKANWPDAKVFDFNKLERIAGFKVQGKELPLCKINGKTYGLAEFYDAVGTDVSNSIDASRMRQPWMADRWGFRARQSIELLDVVAEQTARGEGPVALLRERYPNADVEVKVTGRDGAHEQFVYTVKQNGQEKASFAQGSDGELGRLDRWDRTNPVLFTANIGEEGDLSLDIPETISAHRFPIASTYDIGDSIDMHYIDPNAVESQEEGKAFTTPSRVLEAKIQSYDADGNYTVAFKTPEGEEKTKKISLSDIRRANNPHYFKPKSSYFSDVTINLQTDEALKSFLDEAQPIIDRYLPADGSTTNMTPQELSKRQKDLIDALMDYTHDRVKYPASKDSSPDANSQKYHDFVDGYGRFPLGELVKLGKGVCRHQCILEHLLLQRAGIDSRLGSGAANTSSGNFRGYHIWAEVTLANGERFLSDQTWNDPAIPLWDGAYDSDKRRTEMYRRTARYDYALEMDR